MPLDVFGNKAAFASNKRFESSGLFFPPQKSWHGTNHEQYSHRKVNPLQVPIVEIRE